MQITFTTVFVATLMIGAGSGLARAQAGSSDRTPSPEIAIGVGKFPTYYGDVITQDLKEPTFDFGVTVPFSPRFAIEGIGTVGRRSSAFVSRTEGLYLAQVRQRLRGLEHNGWRPFLTYGFAGYYAASRQPAMDIPQPGGIIIHRPAMSYRTVEEFVAVLVGGGVQRRLNHRLAIRADAQLQTILWLPIGFRFSAGVSVPIGAGF